MKERQFKIGETRKATVGSWTRLCLICRDELNEGHVIHGVDTEPCAVGDTGTLTFTKGGPKGGYWKFTKDVFE